MKNSFNISARLVTKFLQICKKLNINNILKNISWNTELSAVLLSIGTNSPFQTTNKCVLAAIGADAMVVPPSPHRLNSVCALCRGSQFSSKNAMNSPRLR